MKEMKISIPQKKEKNLYFTPDKFVFTDDEENKILVQWNRDARQMVDIFLDEYKKLAEKQNPDYMKNKALFYEILEDRLKPNWIEIFILDEINV